jgi:colicin import membrane protein
MLRRADSPSPPDVTDSAAAVDPHPAPRYRRSRPGPLDALLDTGPGFATTLRGYDRLQVDNYVAWAEAELCTARRQTDDLMGRYGQACAELELSRRLLARSAEGQELAVLSERMGTMLRLAADEAADLTAAAREEADRIVAEARADADARLRKASTIKQTAIEAGDRFRDEALRLRQEAAAELEDARRQAAAELERVRVQAEELGRSMEAEQRERQAEVARAAAAQLAELQAEVDDLHRQRAAARESLRRLTEQLDDALQALSGTAQGTAELVVAGNVVRG